MEKTLKLLSRGFESSSMMTPEFKAYARTFKSEMKKEIEKAGGELVAFNVGHFYVSGFFKVGEQHYYFSQSDVRNGTGGILGADNLLLRTAKNARDFSGGSNNYRELGAGMFERLPQS